MGDFKKEWFAKSQVDYFTSFVSLWLSCNSWYNFHYSLNNDRKHINKIKSDTGQTNKLFKEFEKLFTGSSTKEQKSLFSNIELLHYSLNRKLLTAPKLLKPLSLNMALIDWDGKDNNNSYVDLILSNAKTKTGKLKANINGINLGDIVIVNNVQQIFAGLFEIIYQVRCLLVHGDLEPTEDNYEIVKYCYLILHDLMKPFCS
ncbi:hypothetical protein [Parabacteroides bouchesdurhonensis]|uniref:hypothetical protein n=1 Tax=Parabacteroides bouchesdurhonensis TaxID=1936995 RepID=UPI001C9D3AFE|nr:hypothetical protein [Parabacteroides bouchesdurhonensis]